MATYAYVSCTLGECLSVCYVACTHITKIKIDKNPYHNEFISTLSCVVMVKKTFIKFSYDVYHFYFISRISFRQHIIKWKK